MTMGRICKKMLHRKLRSFCNLHVVLTFQIDSVCFHCNAVESGKQGRKRL